MQHYRNLQEMRRYTENLTPAQIVDALYSRMENPQKFGDDFANDEVCSIGYTRPRRSFAQEIIRLLMSCVRADAEKNDEDVQEAIHDASQTVLSALEEARLCGGSYSR